MATGAVLPPRFDALAPEVLDDPFPTYAALRADAPVCRGGPAQWFVLRHSDVVRLLRDRRVSRAFPKEFHEFAIGPGPIREFRLRLVVNQEGADHVRLRQLFGRRFAPKQVQALTRYVEEQTDVRLDHILETGTMEAVGDLAWPVPVDAICEVIGVPGDERHEVSGQAAHLEKVLAATSDDSDRAAANEALVWLEDYFGACLDQRRRRPRDDLISELAEAEAASVAQRPEIVDNVIFALLEGFQTTMSMLSTACAALAVRPDQLALLQRDPGLLPRAVEELLRFDAPFQSTARFTLEPVEIAGRKISRGRVLSLVLGSANHDEAVFRGPDRLDVTRDPNPHVSFGGGIHHCLGAALVRLEGAAVLGRLVRRVGQLAPAGDPVRRPSPSLRSLSSVPLVVKAL